MAAPLQTTFVFWFCFLAMHRLGYAGLTSVWGCLGNAWGVLATPGAAGRAAGSATAGVAGAGGDVGTGACGPGGTAAGFSRVRT